MQILKRNQKFFLQKIFLHFMTTFHNSSYMIETFLYDRNQLRWIGS